MFIFFVCIVLFLLLMWYSTCLYIKCSLLLLFGVEYGGNRESENNVSNGNMAETSCRSA